MPILIVLCIVGWSFAIIFDKLATRHANPFSIMMIGCYVYSAVAPVLFLYMKASGIDTGLNIGAIAWTVAACVSALIANIAFITAIKRSYVNTIVGLTSSYPVFTFLLCVLLLGEKVSITKMIGITIIAIGTALLML